MSVIFFGTSDYCLPVLEVLNLNFELKLVVTRPDKPVGRKKVLTPSATKKWAWEKGIEVATPATLKKDTSDRLKLIELIELIKPDIAVVSDYGLIIPEGIFTLPKHGTINIHFSRLPDLRGPSPVQFGLLRGDQEAWMTIFRIENPPELDIKMDSGAIIEQKSYPIYPDDTTSTLYTRLFKEASKILPGVIKDYCLQTTALKQQNHSKATFCRFLAKEDGFIDWQVLEKAIRGDPPAGEAGRLAASDLPKIQQQAMKTADYRLPTTANTAYNFYRGVTPWPGVWTYVPTTNHELRTTNPKRMKILKCHLEKDKLVLDQVQFEGKTSVNWEMVKSLIL